MNPMNAIHCQQVKKSYANKSVLNGVNLSVKQGDFFSLVGMNGCGKSTLIKSILDLTSIDDGEISLWESSHLKASARKNIVYLPDRFSPPAYLNAKDFIAYMLSLYGVKKDQNEVDNVLMSLGLEKNMLNLAVNKLSKGMTQKLGLAACLLSDKKLLILDEPMSGLDPKARILFKQQLKLLKAKGVSVFFSSHVLADVDELADNMAVLHDGKILFSGKPQTFKESYQADSLEQAYMSCIEN